MTQQRRRAVWIGVAAVAAIAAYWIFHRGGDSTTTVGKGARGGDLQAVSVAKAQLGPMLVQLTGLGTVTPRSTVTVHSQIDGQLMKVYFTDGQLVKAGDPLADLDSRSAEATLAQAQGQKTRDEALLETAKIDLQRYQTLLTQDSIAKQQVDTQASLVKQYEGAIQTDQGQIAAAQVQVAYSHIKAPVSGRVGLRQVDPGNIVHSGDTNGLVVITQLQPINTLFTVPEDKLGDVMQRMAESGPSNTLPVEVWDRSNKILIASGTLVAVDNQVDVSTGTVRLKAEFPNTDQKLFPNQFVNARLQLEQRENQIIVPASAVQQGAKGPYVFVVTNSPTTISSGHKTETAEATEASPTTSAKKHGGAGGGTSPWIVNMRPVTVGPAQDDSISIITGLQADEIVVTDGADKLRDNGRIMIPAFQHHHGTDASATTPAPDASAPSDVSSSEIEKSETPAHHKKRDHNSSGNNGGSGNGNAD